MLAGPSSTELVTGSVLLSNSAPIESRVMNEPPFLSRVDIELAWLRECGADLRARTQAEYLYTAAALDLCSEEFVGSSRLIRRWFTIAAAVAVILLVTIAVVLKVKWWITRCICQFRPPARKPPRAWKAGIPRSNIFSPGSIKDPSSAPRHVVSLRGLFDELRKPRESPGYVFSLSRSARCRSRFSSVSAQPSWVS